MKKIVSLLFVIGSLVQLNAATLTFNWNPNKETNIAGYKVYSQYNNTTTTNTFSTTNGTVTVPLGVNATFWATAFNTAKIESSPSTKLNFTAGIPPAPTITTNLLVNNITNWVISLAWTPTPPSYLGLGYYITIDDTSAAQTFFTTNTVFAFNANPADYYVYIQATNVLGASPKTGTVVTYNFVAPPQGFTIQSVSQ